MSKISLMDRFLSLSEEEKSKYLPSKKYELYSDIREGNILIKNVPHISYTQPTLKSSFVPPEVEKMIINYLYNNDTEIKNSDILNFDSSIKVIEYSKIIEKEYAAH